jgi:type I restriction-modification system DNA methylase subunit
MKLTQRQLENHLWGAANILRGKTAGQDYKNYILSLQVPAIGKEQRMAHEDC